MISCRLKGGLGNIMFQIAAIESMSKKHNIEAGYYNVNDQIQKIDDDAVHNPSIKHAKDYLKIFENFKWKIIEKPNNKIDVPFHYTKLTPINNTIYDGFFQSEKYFLNRKFIIDLFQPSKFVIDKLQKYDSVLKENTCSIHIRRGDYLKYSMHVSRDIEYYKKGIELIGKVDRYLIFSDDIQWCKNNFKGNEYLFIENERDYIEIFLQSLCNHNIISSSSFSWWGAYLNNNLNKKVIAPLEWFNGGKFDSKDIVPPNWIKI